MKYSRKTIHLGAQATTFRNADHLRTHETKAEKILWEHLRNRQMEGIKFRRQHPTKKDVVDFFASELKLVIELDGDYHHDDTQVFADEQRDKNLLLDQFITIRFSDDQIFNSLENVLDSIRYKIRSLKSFKKV
ncbi:MAG: endonuclease domain-containing protein [Saprospiraceae bacterium]